MIVTRTPLRISLFGGGSDIPAYYEKYGGMVISASIDKYIRIALQKVQPKHIKVMYSQVEQVSRVSELKHQLVKACLERLGPMSNVEIASFADVSTNGTGLGSSSTFVVGLLKTLHAFNRKKISRSALAEEACDIEINQCGAKIGKQDQYAAAFGGLNVIDFNKKTVRVHLASASQGTIDRLNSNLFLVPTGPRSVSTNALLTPTVNALEANDKNVTTAITSLLLIANEACHALQSGDVDYIGELLDQSWKFKKQMTPHAVTPEIQRLYEVCKEDGATGGKILGAGGGGYLLIYVPANKQQANWWHIANHVERFKFTDEGSTVVFNDE